MQREFSWKHIFIKDFNISLFIGLCILAAYHSLPDGMLSAGEFESFGLIAMTNGFLTAFVMLLLNRFFSQSRFTPVYYTADKFRLFLASFFAGLCACLITVSDGATYLISATVLILAVLRIKKFIQKLSQLLRPENFADLEDIGNFSNFFITLIISFAVINLSLNTLHQNIGQRPAFNFASGIEGIIDAVYFSIITMTTVGYGNIVPQTGLARIFVSFECITCYLTLAVMIGIITRGLKLK